MNGFLVILRCNIDDFPVSLHATETEAIDAAKAVAGDPGPTLRAMEDIFTLDASEAAGVCVVAFVGGKPAWSKDQRHFGKVEACGEPVG